jgi:hypothetical protein
MVLHELNKTIPL